MSEQPYLKSLSEELTTKLGKAIWSFAQVEWLTYQYLEELCNEDLISLVGDLSFTRRLNILEKLVKRHSGNNILKEEILVLLKNAREFSVQRNTIVHNPWQVYIDFDEMDFTSKIFKYTKQEHNYSPEAVKEFSVNVDKLHDDLKDKLSSLLNKSLMASLGFKPDK